MNLHLGGKTFKVELADSVLKRAWGLMDRSSTGENEGMLFCFRKSGFYAFHMNRVTFPLDIIWLDEAHRIVDISHHALPSKNMKESTYIPERPVRFVLELSGGKSERLGLEKGMEVNWEAQGDSPPQIKRDCPLEK